MVQSERGRMDFLLHGVQRVPSTPLGLKPCLGNTSPTPAVLLIVTFTSPQIADLLSAGLCDQQPLPFFGRGS